MHWVLLIDFVIGMAAFCVLVQQLLEGWACNWGRS